MNVKAGFIRLVRVLLPPEKRQTKRLDWLQPLIAVPLNTLFASFDGWRTNTRMMINVNSQVKVFEGYLRKKYNEPIAIKIVTFEDGLLPVCLEEEGTTQQPSFGDEVADMVAIPLDGEMRLLFGDVDFVVYIPKGVNADLIGAEVEKYKQALTTFKIIQQ
jgi:hypothetical protein